MVTWNLWWRFGDWERRLDAIRSVLTELQPDVCGFQEVWTERGRNQAEVLAAEFGMYGSFAPVPVLAARRRDFPDHTVGAGNAVISRWPIRESNICQLPGDDGRNVLHTAIDAPPGRLDFFTTQLTSAVGRSADRRTQIADVGKFIVAKRNGIYPPILTGDFNAEPDSDEMRQLGGHLTKGLTKNLVLIDAWRYADAGEHGFTWDRRNPHVRASLEPSARIDYIMVGPPVAAGRGAVEFVRLCGTEPVNDVWASDHAGVVADLRI